MVQTKVLAHSAVKLSGKKTVYFDPFQVDKAYGDADLILVTHEHFDHFSVEDIMKVRKGESLLVAPLHDKETVEAKSGFDGARLLFMRPGETVVLRDRDGILGVKPESEAPADTDITVEAIPAYNIGKKFHPKANEWLGYKVTMEGKSYYVAGDTDATEELLSVKTDVAFLPCGGTYTMTLEEAAEAGAQMDAVTVIPTHYGAVCGDKNDGFRFNLLWVKKRLPKLKAIFEAEGLPASVYAETITDIDAKIAECKRVYGVEGIMHIQNWYGKFMQGKIRRYGRLEFEIIEAKTLVDKVPELAEKMEGIPYIIGVHIPSNGGPFTEEERLRSYKMAYEAFVKNGKYFPNGLLITECHSWMLYPGFKDLLPEGGQIRKFMDEFTLVHVDKREGFPNAWRIYGAAALGDPKDLPEETSLQRALKPLMLRGESTGLGLGVALFDGEKRILDF